MQLSNIASPLTTQTLKASRFNSFVPYEGKVVGFNAFTQEFLLLEPLLKDLYEAAVHENDILGLKEIHPDFFQALLDKEFFVEESADELQKVKDLRERVDFSEDKYHLTINPTMNCNFKCWYCYESHVKGSKMNPKTIEAINNHVTQVMETKDSLKSFHISWFGGEPMLYFDHVVVPIVSSTYTKALEKEIKFTTSFTTNGYLIRERMIPFFKEYNVGHFQITLDGHREKHNEVRFTANEKGTYDEIIQSIKLLCTNQIFVMVRINYTNETLEKIESVMDDFADLTDADKSHMKFSFHNVWQDKNPNQEKLEKLITRFRQSGFYTESVFSLADTVRNSCYADKKNHATINYNGEVFKCTARDFKSHNKEGQLTADGTIIWNEKFHKRMDSKFKNSPCLSCRIQPICNGGCSQQALEHGEVEYCIWEGSGISKDEIIISKFKQMIEHLTN